MDCPERFFREFYQAALQSAIETDDYLRVVSPEWMVILKYIRGRGKDQIDLMWLLQQPGLVDRAEVHSLMIGVVGETSAALSLRELEKLFLQAELTARQEEQEG